MKNHDLERFSNMVNLGSNFSFLLKNVKPLRVKRSVPQVLSTKSSVRVFVEVEHEGRTTRWDCEAEDFQVLDGLMKEF